MVEVSKYEDDYVMKSGKGFSEVINGLPKNGTYYFEKVFEVDSYQISDNYVSSSYSATNVVYPINGYNLSWVEFIYNWN